MNARNLLVMTFTDMNISIQSFDFYFCTACGYTSSSEAVCTEDKLAAGMLFLRLARRQRRHLEVAVDLAVEGFEAQIGGKLGQEVQVDVAIKIGRASCRERV